MTNGGNLQSGEEGNLSWILDDGGLEVTDLRPVKTKMIKADRSWNVEASLMQRGSWSREQARPLCKVQIFWYKADCYGFFVELAQKPLHSANMWWMPAMCQALF